MRLILLACALAALVGGQTTRIDIYSQGSPTLSFLPQEAPSGSKNPASITFSVVGRFRMVDPWPEDRFIICQEEFNEDGVTGLAATNISGTGTTAQSAGQLTLTAGGGGAWHTMARTRAEIPVPYVYAQTRIISWGGTDSDPGVYIGKNSTNYARIYVDDSDSDYMKLETRVNNNATTQTSTTVVEAGDEIMLVLTYPEVWGYIRKPGLGWTPVLWQTFTASGTASSQDLRLDSIRTGWRPAVGANLAASATAKFEYIRSGIIGGVGLRDFKPIVNKTGRPLLYQGKAWFTATMASGSDFMTNHMAIISVDVFSGEVRVQSHLFFRPNSTTTTAMYGGQAMLDTTTGLWRVFSNGWGYQRGSTSWWSGGVANTRIELWGASTYEDLFAPNKIHVLDTQTLTYDSTASVYDNSVRYDSATGTWWMVATETNDPTGWTAWKPTLYSTTGDPITGSWTTVQDGDASYPGEGTLWTYLNSTWWIIAGGLNANPGPRLYTALLRKPSDNTAGQSDYLESWVFADGLLAPNSPHFAVVPYYHGGTSTVRYIMVTFDQTVLASSGATQGAIIVMRGV